VRHIEILAEVPDNVCRLLRIDTTERAVMMSQGTVSHIFEQRSFHGAAMIVGVLARGDLNPVYCGRDLVYPRTFFIVEASGVGIDAWVKIVLKPVMAPSSASRHDEIWVVTAHRVVDSTLNRMLIGNRFVMYRTTRDR
jgi:hypothetical protein